jgi:hypothetical protein
MCVGNYVYDGKPPSQLPDLPTGFSAKSAATVGSDGICERLAAERPRL